MPEKASQNHQKNAGKFFGRVVKQLPKGVLSIYVVNALHESTEPLTVLSIRKAIKIAEGRDYCKEAVQAAINNLQAFGDFATITTTELRAGRSKAQAFSIQLKSKQPC